MPLPQVTNVGNMTYILLRGVSGRNVRHRDFVGIVPMVTGTRFMQTGDDFTIMIMTQTPLEPNAVRGVPPSDIFTLRLKTREETQRLIQEPVSTDHPQTLRVPTGPFASNAPITMDLRDTELRDIFRMFGEQVNKNIIIHDLPPVLVTMTFRDSPLSTVFGFLMRNYDLAYEFIDANTIVIGTAAGMARVSGRQETRSYRIAYADASAVAGLLPNLTRISSANLVVDPRLRTIHATGTPDILEEVTIAIQELDNPGRQVMIYARILEFDYGDSLEVEHALNAVYDHWALTFTGPTGLTGIFIDDNRANRPPTIGHSDDGRFIPPGLGRGNLATPMQGIWRQFDASFRALESTTSMRTLANPSVITIDGMSATINLTQEVPYISGRDDGGNPTWATVSIGPRLTFTPTVGRDNIITLELDLQASEEGAERIGGMGETMPTAVQRQVLTNVRVRNGEPFVVGGLYRTRTTNTRMRVPLLGQLPLLGELFTFRSRGTDTTQVVMLVIPYILHTPDVGVEHNRLMIRR